MKKLIALTTLLTALAFAQDASRVLTGSAQPPLPFNILPQPGFENRTTGWSVNGGTFTTVSDTANVARGRFSGSWLLPASTVAGVLLQSDDTAIPSGLLARQCRGKILYKGNALTNGALSVEAYDGTTVYGNVALADVSTYTPAVTSTFTCPTSGNLRFRVKSTATSPSNPTLVYFDEVFLGEAEAIGTGSLTGVAAFGSSPNSSGASLSGTNLILQPASGTQPGGVSNTTQTFAGAKTFSVAPTVTGLTSGPVINTSGLISSEAQLDRTRGGTGISSTATFPASGITATVPSSGVVKSNGTALTSSNVGLTTEVTGVLPIANGGTGQSTTNNAINGLLPSQSGNTGKFLKTDGSLTSWASSVSGPATTVASQMAFWDNATGTLLGNDVNFTYDKNSNFLSIDPGSIALSNLVSSNDYGFAVQGTHNANGGNLKLILLDLTGDFFGTAAPGEDEMYGIKMDISTNPSGSGKLSSGHGQRITYARSGDDTTPNHYGLRISMDDNAVTTPGVGTMYGVAIDGTKGVGATNLNNWYGLYVNPIASGVTNGRYSLYVDGSASSYFNGRIEAANNLWVYGAPATMRVWANSGSVGDAILTVFNPIQSPSNSCGIFCVTYDRGTKIQGTKTNDSAAVGYVGEWKEGLLAQASAITLTTATAADVTSITLSAGDWLVSGLCNFNAAVVVGTQSICAVTSTSGNSLTGANRGENRVETPDVPTAASDVSMSIPQYHVQLSATTTYYLKAQSTFSSGTNKVNGRISAVRIR